MRILVTGAGGQLGSAVMDELRRRGCACLGVSRHARGADCRALDLTDAAATAELLSRYAPDVIVHCAAWTAVDAAEEEINRPAVHAINADATANLARLAAQLGASLLYLSSDYVFDGRGSALRQADSPDFGPLNYYGQTKLEGEQAVRAATQRHFIVRTSWVFAERGGNFVRTMLRLGRERGSVRVVDDQIGRPTYARDLARLLADMSETRRYGTYHATNEGACISWCEFAREIFRRADMEVEVIPVSTEEYGLTRAERPRNSRLDTSRLLACGFRPLPDWRDALHRCLAEMLS